MGRTAWQLHLILDTKLQASARLAVHKKQTHKDPFTSLAFKQT